MTERQIAYGQFIIHPKNSKSTCKIFISSLEKEKDFGKLFGLIEIESPQNKTNLQILDNLATEIENSYFKTAEREVCKTSLPITENQQPNFESVFEHTLHKINQLFFEINNRLFLSQISFEPKIKASGKINALLALFKNNNLYLTQSGRIFSFLIYQTKPNDYRIINILENAAGEDKQNNKYGASFFSNIITGEVEPGSLILFCTESVLDYLSLDKLKKTIAGQPPEEASHLIKDLLDEIESSNSFAALIIGTQVKTEETNPFPAVQIPDEKTSPIQSIEQLLATESRTEKLLVPSLKLDFKKYLSNILTRLKFVKFKENTNLKNKIVTIFKILIYFPLIFVGKILYSIFQIFYKLTLVILYSVAKKNDKRNQTIQEILQIINQPKRKIINWFYALPRQSKILLIIAVISIILFVQSIIFLNRKYKNEAEVEAYNVIINTIQEKKDLAEASLIYNDEENAKQKLLEAKKLIETLPQNSQKKKETKENLLREIEILFTKLQHIEEISDPFLIVDLQNQEQHQEQQIFVRDLFATENYLYTFDYQNNLIYKINRENKEIKIFNSTLPTSSRLELGVLKDKNSILFYHSGRGFFEFNLENQIGKTIEINFSDNTQEFKDIDIYNQKIYLLDTVNNQIWKHTPTLSGYGRGSAWLKENIDIRSATSLAIDGSIYLTLSNGEILRLGSGYKENFEAKIDPALTLPTKIWTSLNTKYIYILEPQTKRLIVLDKNGKLKIQYRSNKFDNLADFVVLEKEKKIYLLNGTKIYGIAANHL